MAAVPRLRPVPFWFLRHGETDWNAQGLSQGSTDIPLNAVVLAQAERAARTLEGIGGIATIVASPLSRPAQRSAADRSSSSIPISRRRLRRVSMPRSRTTSAAASPAVASTRRV